MYQRIRPQPLVAVSKKICKHVCRYTKNGNFFLFLYHLPRKQLKTTTGPVGIFPEEKSIIGSAVTEILCFIQTNRHHSTILLCVIDQRLRLPRFEYLYLIKLSRIIVKSFHLSLQLLMASGQSVKFVLKYFIS